jgi:hypothetical protein
MIGPLHIPEFREAIFMANALRRKLNGTKAEIEASLPDMTFISPDQAAELHAMIPGFKPWPVGS